MAQPRLLGAPSTSTPSTSSTIRGTSATSTSKSSSAAYRPPTVSRSTGAPSSSAGTPLLSRRLSPPIPTPKPASTKKLGLGIPTLIPAIDRLRARLPTIPSLLSIPWPNGRQNPYMHNNRANEEGEAERGTPFESWEWERLQYMSLTGEKDRELERGLVKSGGRGAWEEVKRADPWWDGVVEVGEEDLGKGDMGKMERASAGASPWNEGGGGGSGNGSGNNTVARTQTQTQTGERKKVSLGDYLKKKRDSPKDTMVKKSNGDSRLEVPKVPTVVVNGNGVSADKSDSTKSQEPRKEAAITKPDAPDPYAIKQDFELPAMEKKAAPRAEPPAAVAVRANGHGPPAKPASPNTNDRAKLISQTEKEEGEFADEHSIPASIANILKAPPGPPGKVMPPQKVMPHKEKPTEVQKTWNKRPFDDEKKTEEAVKRQKVDVKNGAGAGGTKPYTGTARPHQRNISDSKSPSSLANKKTAVAHPLARPREERGRVDGGASRVGAKTGAMPRLLSPLPDHLSSTNGTPMSRGDSRDSRRERSPARSQPMAKSDSRGSRRDRSPPRSQPMAKGDSRDSRRDRSPARSQPMAKSDPRDSRRDRSPRRARSRSLPRSQAMGKSDSRESRRERSPIREHRRDRERSPLRSQPMGKSDSKDSRGGRSPKNDAAPAPVAKAKPAATTAYSATTSSAVKTGSAPKKETKKEEVRKEPIPMPKMMAFDLPTIVEADMKRRMDGGEMKDDVAAAFERISGHKRNISNGSNGSSLSNGRKGMETRESTPGVGTDREKGEKKKTSTQALRERARKPDTPGVARKAVAPKNKAKAQEQEREKLVIKLKYRSRSDLSSTIETILKGKATTGLTLPDYQGRRGREMVARRVEVVKRDIKKEGNKRARPEPESDEDEDREPIKRSRKDGGQAPSTPVPSSTSQPLAPPSISRLKNEHTTPDKANTPGDTPKMDISPTATRSAPATNAALTDKQKEMLKVVKAESERYIGLGTTLKRQRDALIRPPAEKGKMVGEEEQKKANIMGAESLLAYLVGFEAMDRAYETEGSRNTGKHWRSLFPYLESYRVALKASTTATDNSDKAKVVLDIVTTAVGYAGARCLATLHNNLLEKEGAPNSRDEMLGFIKELTANFKRREVMGEGYRKRCLEVSERWPELVGEGKKLSWIRSPGGQFGGVEEVKGKLAGIMREVCGESKIELESKLDF